MENTNKFKKILENTNIGIIETDLNGKITYINKKAKEIIGIKLDNKTSLLSNKNPL